MDIWKELKQEGWTPACWRRSRPSGTPTPFRRRLPGGCPVPAFSTTARRSGRGAAAALLCGEHLLLAGPKATVFAQGGYWDVSMYVNVMPPPLIGADTLQDGQVAFREGPVCQCARLGGFGVLDEVNMAKK